MCQEKSSQAYKTTDNIFEALQNADHFLIERKLLFIASTSRFRAQTFHNYNPNTCHYSGELLQFIIQQENAIYYNSATSQSHCLSIVSHLLLIRVC